MIAVNSFSHILYDIPVMQVEFSDKEAPGASIEELSLSAKTDQDSVNSLYLKVGDKEYDFEDLRKYRTVLC